MSVNALDAGISKANNAVMQVHCVYILL